MGQQQKLEQLLVRQIVKDPEAHQAIREHFQPTITPPADPMNPGKAPAPPPRNVGGLVLGGTGMAKAVDGVNTAFPMLQGAKSIQVGPLPEVIRMMANEKKPANWDTMEGTNLLGVTSKDGRIGLNPDSMEDQTVIIHELGHAKGLSEIGARALEELMRRAVGTQPINDLIDPKTDLNTLRKILELSQRATK